MKTETTSIAHETMEAFYALPKFRCCTVGKMSLIEETYKTGSTIEVIGMREALYSGQMPVRMILDEDFTIHKLKSEDDGIWMSNHPREIAQMLSMINAAHGRVLVGGLGMGIVAYLMAARKEVKSVHVIERDADVVKLVTDLWGSAHLESDVDTNPFYKISILNMNLFEAVKSARAFDFAFLDIWQGTGEYVWTSQLVPLKRLIGTKIKTVIGWEEETMKGQVLQGLGNTMIDGINLPPHYETFCDALRAAGVMAQYTHKGDDQKSLQQAIMNLWEHRSKTNKKTQELGSLFVNGPGSEEWERTFGKFWDTHFTKEMVDDGNE